MSCAVRLGARKHRCNDDLSDTLHAQLNARPPRLLESLAGLSSIKVNVAIPEHLKTTGIKPLSIQHTNDLLNVSSIGWFPSGRINEVHVESEVKWRNLSAKFDQGSLQTMALDMLNLLAVSAGKHVLLGADKGCKRPILCIKGLTFEEVKVVLDLVNLISRPELPNDVLRNIPCSGSTSSSTRRSTRQSRSSFA
jgi:hypothetical protein